MPLTPGTPFVVFGDDWGRYPSTFQHIFRHIAPRYPVVWVNGIGHRVPQLNLTDLRRACEKIARAVQMSDEAAVPARHLGGGIPVTIIDPWVLPWHQFGMVHQFNSWSLTKAITSRLSALGLREAPVLVTGSPPSVGVLGRLGEIASIYFVLDDYLNFPSYTSSMLAPLEQRLLNQVDLVVATAASLTRTKYPRSGKVHHLPQGVNYDHFAEPRVEPADMAGIPRPRIGFAGTLSSNCDIGLIARLAEDNPDAGLVFVGPVALDESSLKRLRRPNVHLLGVRPYEVLPAYVQHFDVGIIPYAINPWTIAVDSLKLLEYLAAGLPVVSTAIPEAAKYAHVASVVSNTEAFLAAVGDALEMDRAAVRARGQLLARENIWERRADTLLELVDDTIRSQERL